MMRLGPKAPLGIGLPRALAQLEIGGGRPSPTAPAPSGFVLMADGSKLLQADGTSKILKAGD